MNAPAVIDTQNKAPVRILLVEDNPGDVHLLEKALQSREMHYDLIHYEDGEQAMLALSNDPALAPDVILLDLNLPRRGGLDVLRLVRTMPRLVGVPVGVLTSSTAATDRSRTTIIGVDKFIHKPSTLEEFLEEVGRAVAELLALGQSVRKTSAG